MERSDLLAIADQTPTPCYVIHEGVLRKNLDILKEVQDRTHCKIFLALKGFAAFCTFPLLRNVLHGTCASSLYEARLGREEFGGEVHVYSPAYSEQDMAGLLPLVDHIIFNNFQQWRRYRKEVNLCKRRVGVGIRINPEHSEGDVALYDPCVEASRLGSTIKVFEGESLDGISGLHFHTLCGHNADALERTLQVVEKKFGHFFTDLVWINFGGGHHITRSDYDLDKLCDAIVHVQETYGVHVYLEPDEAVALEAGVLLSSVLDIAENDAHIAILDTSTTAHMPDVLEMPYRPDVFDAGQPHEKKYTYRLGGQTCLAGDVIGDYSFDKPLCIGQKIVFMDMAHYTMVKNTMFNGIGLPSIATYDPQTERVTLVKTFDYHDYKNRLS